MVRFWDLQTDYIVFFYGLALSALSIVCLGLARSRDSRLPWSWLGLFGLLNGLTEWMELLTHAVENVAWLEGLHSAALAISFAALFEFGRTGLQKTRGKAPPRYSLILLLGLAAWGAHSKALGSEPAVLYLVALPAGMLSAAAFFSAAPTAERRARRLLLLAGGLTALYAMASGLLVPQATLFPARILNDRTFLRLAGLPPDLIRGVIVACLSWMVAVYSEASMSARESHGRPLPFWTFGWGVLALTAIVGTGWFATDKVGQAADSFCRTNLLRRAISAASGIDTRAASGLTASLSDRDSADFSRLRHQLRLIRITNDDCRFVYLMGMKKGKAVFLADAEPEHSRDYSPPGEEYDHASEELCHLFTGGRGFVEGPGTDDWGTWVSGMAPVPEARVHGAGVVIGLDIDASEWQRTVAAYRLMCILVILLLCLLTLTFMLVQIKTKAAHTRIAVSENRYRGLVESSPYWISLLDAQGRFLSVNRTGLTLLGQGVDKLIGTSYEEMWWPEARPLVHHCVERTLEGIEHEFEAELVAPGGRLSSWHVTVGPIVEDFGTIRHIVAIGTDVTESRQIERALCESEEKYRNLVDRANDGIVIIAGERLVYVNQRFADMMASTIEQLTNTAVGQLIHLELHQQLIDSCTRLFGGEDVPSVYESVLVRPDGSRLDVEINVGLINYDGSSAAMVLVRDITLRKATEQRTAQSRDYYLTLLEGSPSLIWRAGPDGRCNYFNKTWLAFTGRTMEQELGDGWADGLHPDDKQRRLKNAVAAFFAREPVEQEYRLRRHDGEYRWMIDRASPLHNSDGGFVGYIGSCLDITEMKRAESDMRMHVSAMNAASDQIIIMNARCMIEFVNPSFERETGYSSAEIIGKRADVLAPNGPEDASYEQLWQIISSGHAWHGELGTKRRDGSLCTEELTITPVKNDHGEIEHFVIIKRDVTEKKSYEKKLDQLAHHDHLTGLPNRLLFADRLNHSLTRARRTGTGLAVMFLDLDRFKIINDTLGHSTGDLLLKSVADRLTRCLRESDTVARMGGDEFTVILSDVEQASNATEVAEKMLDALSSSFYINGRELFVSVSIGISQYPADGANVETLVKNADMAMYRAKEAGRNNYQLCTWAMNAAAIERMEMDRGLRGAVERGEFVAHYQPKVDLRTGRISGVEALVRWQHPELGIVSPAQFISVAEENGLIVPIGDWVMKTACAQNKAWQDAGLPKIPIAVNMSPRQFRQKDLVEAIDKTLQSTGLDPHYLELEITEGAIMHKPAAAAAALRKLKDMGIRITIDDFGSGHSSLNYLKRFPIDALKIDHSFVKDITTDSDDAAIAQAIIAMARSLKLSVVAEGVETLEQLELLRSLECDEIQGYFISRPMRGELVAAVIADNNRGADDTVILPAA